MAPLEGQIGDLEAGWEMPFDGLTQRLLASTLIRVPGCLELRRGQFRPDGHAADASAYCLLLPSWL